MRKLFILLALLLSFIPIQAQAVTYDGGISSVGTLVLDNKDTVWARVTDGKYGTLTYNSEGATFNFSFTGVGLEVSTAYSLIYYANPYPGNNPGALIGVGTSGTDGGLVITGTPNLNMNLPTPPDANMLIDHSVAPDNYAHKYGAKIWLVPSDCYSGTSVTVWSPTRFLFETDVITYTDTDLEGGSGVPLSTTVTEPTATIGLSITPSTVGYGSVAMGVCSAWNPITLTNTGNVPIKVTASTSTGFYTDCLYIAETKANGWVSPIIPVGTSYTIQTKVCPTSTYSGTLTGTLSFMASFAP